MLFESLKYDCVNNFLKELLTQDRYKKITPSCAVLDNYFISSKYAFYLGIDAISKFEIIINDMSYIDDYVEQLERIFKKIDNEDDIRLGIYALIAKIVSVKLALNNTNSLVSRERILYYIYDRYIVNGYFYFGFSSFFSNEISCIGLNKNSLTYDERLIEINDMFKKTCKKTLFVQEKVNVTDDIIRAMYYALLSPNYLTSMATNSLFDNKKYDKECFYTKDIIKIKENLRLLLNDFGFSIEDKKNIINKFVDAYVDSRQNNAHPCIARIKRSVFGKEKLKDIDQIIHSKDESLANSIELIVDSRYASYDLVDDVFYDSIEIIDVPSYNEFLLGKSNYFVVPVVEELSKEDLEVDDSIVTNNMTVNSYGAVSFAIVGVLFIIVGTIMTIVLRAMGG